MSIEMQRFASTGLFPTLKPKASLENRAAMFIVQCHSCGFEPDADGDTPRVCPKCAGRSWERVARPRSLLANAGRFR